MTHARGSEEKKREDRNKYLTSRIIHEIKVSAEQPMPMEAVWHASQWGLKN